MKISTSFAIIIFFLLFSKSGFSQAPAQAEIPGTEAADFRLKRNTQLKADILQEIKALSPKEQGYYNTLLGSLYWDKNNRKEGFLWLRKALNRELLLPIIKMTFKNYEVFGKFWIWFWEKIRF